MHALRTPARCAAPPVVLLGVELAQGAIGYTQYFLNVPPVLVGVHMLGACLVWIAALQVLLALRAVRPHALSSHHAAAGSGSRGQLRREVRTAGQRVDRQPGQRADHGAVDPDELQVAADLQLEPAAGLLGVPSLDGRGDDRRQVVARSASRRAR